MTGFARAAAGDARTEWFWEVRSVNAKGLDVRVRVPSGFDAVETAARDAVGKAFKRGSVTLGLQMRRIEGTGELRINEDALARVLALREKMAGQLSDAKPTLEGLLAIRGIVEIAEPEESEDDVRAREAAVLASLDAALRDLASARAEEGARLETVLAAQLDEVADLTERAAGTAAAQPERLRARLTQQIDEMLEKRSDITEDRLAQEVALLASKADVREELDRLRAHVASAREMIDAGGQVGRRLDFLCQEFNREANTLCSKANDLELTRIGLALKALIEQFREQVQNIE